MFVYLCSCEALAVCKILIFCNDSDKYITASFFFLSFLQGEFGSGLHRVNRGAGTPASAELQADGDPEESFTGAG